MAKIHIKDFNLEYTLFCGQLFRVTKVDNWYVVGTRNRVFRIRQSANQLEYQGIDKNFLIHFLALDEPYSAILAKINKDPFIRKAIEKYHGLRIVRQDPWECLISFICSAAANIPKIKLNLEMLSKFFGRKVTMNSWNGHTFPNPGEINNYEQILLAKTGFRAKHIKYINDLINEDFFNPIRKLSYPEAKNRLKQLPGVGDKIADCVLLFSLGFQEAFPIDTWIKKILQKLYFKNRLISTKELQDFGCNYFGMYAGYAQQFLYIYARELTP